RVMKPKAALKSLKVKVLASASRPSTGRHPGRRVGISLRAASSSFWGIAVAPSVLGRCAASGGFDALFKSITLIAEAEAGVIPDPLGPALAHRTLQGYPGGCRLAQFADWWSILATDSEDAGAGLRHRRQLLGQRVEADGLHAVRQRHALLAGVDDKAALGLEIIAGAVEAALHLGRQAALDLHGPQSGARQLQQQVDLGAARR